MNDKEEALNRDCKALRSQIEKSGFVDYAFVGVTLEGRRVNLYAIGESGKDFGFQNCERWDRLVGALNRMAMAWEIENPQPED